MSCIEYAVYGITELETKKIVFIGYYIYDGSVIDEYPKIKDYLEDATVLMQNDDRGNEYGKDLHYMCNMPKIGDGVGVVVLDIVKDEREAYNLEQEYIKRFKPRYNIIDKD